MEVNNHAEDVIATGTAVLCSELQLPGTSNSRKRTRTGDLFPYLVESLDLLEDVKTENVLSIQVGQLIRENIQTINVVKHLCPHCDYQASRPGHLRQHIQAIHHGIKHPCPHCDYQATRLGHLRQHIQAIHRGVKHPCPHCKYLATRQGHLRQHIRSVHEGIKYPCPHCDHRATRQSHLRQHIRSIHEGIKHPCPHCDYKATRQGHLRQHIKSIHRSLKERLNEEPQLASVVTKTESVDSDATLSAAVSTAFDQQEEIAALRQQIHILQAQSDSAMSGSSSPSPSTKLVCFQCNYEAEDKEALSQHIQSSSHQEAIEADSPTTSATAAAISDLAPFIDFRHSLQESNIS